MKIELSYGKGTQVFSIPEENLGATIGKHDICSLLNSGKVKEIRRDIEHALNHPYASESLERMCKGKRVLLIIEDGTRNEPHKAIISALMRRLHESGDVRVLLSCGSHEPFSERNRAIIDLIQEQAEEAGVPLSDVRPSSCEVSDFTYLGTTSRGTPVEINTMALDAELVVIGADMKNHYFAGYSNALKNILPGISSFRTIECNHSLALHRESTFGHHPLHPDAGRRNNPVAEDMLEAFELFMDHGKEKAKPGTCDGKQCFVLATVSSDDGILWTGSGDICRVTEEGIRVTDSLFSFDIKRHDYLVVSPGGHPQDESLYNAQRGLELSKNVVGPGGKLLLLASCEKGIAPSQMAVESFYEPLKGEPDRLLKEVKQDYKLYSHKAFKFAEFLKDHDIYLFSELPRQVIEAIHLHAVASPQKLVRKWLEEDPSAEIAFIDDANKIVLRPE